MLSSRPDRMPNLLKKVQLFVPYPHLEWVAMWIEQGKTVHEERGFEPVPAHRSYYRLMPDGSYKLVGLN